MANKTTIVITNNRIPELKRRFPQEVETIVDKTAFDVEAYAKSIVPVDTGTLKNSILTEKLEPTVAIVGPHTEYAQFVEFGTRHMAARPYLTPAAQKAKVKFVEALKQLEARLK